jgi:transcriptional regulator with XRE-family HTH domain
MSANALAKRLGLSRQYISRAEQGTYSKLNPALVRWVSEVSNISVRWVEGAYEYFQHKQRSATIDKVGPHRLLRHEDTSPGAVLFERWRSGYWSSPVSFAIAFCVHPDLVTKYEEGIQKNMPKQIREALIECELLSEDWTD